MLRDVLGKFRLQISYVIYNQVSINEIAEYNK